MKKGENPRRPRDSPILTIRMPGEEEREGKKKKGRSPKRRKNLSEQQKGEGFVFKIAFYHKIGHKQDGEEIRIGSTSGNTPWGGEKRGKKNKKKEGIVIQNSNTSLLFLRPEKGEKVPASWRKGERSC